jgi:hypothetical protein
VTGRLKKKVILAAVLAALLIIAAAVGLAPRLRPIIERTMLTVLRERFQSDVQMKDLQIFVFPRIYAQAGGIVLRHRGRTDVPPLITIEKLTLTANYWGLLRMPKHISSLHLVGLQIHIPPRKEGPSEPAEKAGGKSGESVVVDEADADDASVELAPQKRGKPPLQLEFLHLALQSFGFERPAAFRATLATPKPIGEIEVQGQFGPWQADEPRETPVVGTFHFSHADLATVKGVSGFLSADGKVSGVLERLEVEGDAETPDLAVRSSGNRVPVKLHFVSVVDGSDYNTHLKSAQIHLAHSIIESSGEVVGVLIGKGHHPVTLDAQARDARLEDLLPLAMKGDKPLINGAANFQTRIEVPAGEEDLLDKLLLNGSVDVGGAHFAEPGIQEKIDDLSRKGQGKPEDKSIENVVSHLRGHFAVRNARAAFSDLELDMPGAALNLSGSYDLRTEVLDFHGHARLDAKLSQTTTGAKSFFLKGVDPFFRKSGGGSSIPIKITGTRSKPAFGLDLQHQNTPK